MLSLRLLYLGLFCSLSLAIECDETLNVAAGGGPCKKCTAEGQQCWQKDAQDTTHGRCFKNGDVFSCAFYCRSWVATKANVDKCLDKDLLPKTSDETTPLKSNNEPEPEPEPKLGEAEFIGNCCKRNNQLRNCGKDPKIEEASGTITRIFANGQTLKEAYNALIDAGMARTLASKIGSCCHAGGMSDNPDYSLHITIDHKTQGGHVPCNGAKEIYDSKDEEQWKGKKDKPEKWDTMNIADFQAHFPKRAAKETEAFLSSAEFSIPDQSESYQHDSFHLTQILCLLIFVFVVLMAAFVHHASNKTTLQVEFEAALI